MSSSTFKALAPMIYILQLSRQKAKMNDLMYISIPEVVLYFLHLKFIRHYRNTAIYTYI
nr:MAG TPA: hypothetical protein [Caudoviricetes sp.]